MFLTLWNYLRGYVMIEVSGFSVERLINMSVNKGVFLWDVSSLPDGTAIPIKKPKKPKKRYNRRGELIAEKKAPQKSSKSQPTPSPAGAVRMKVSVRGFRTLRVCAKKTKSKVKILKKYGLPFVLFRYRKRKLFAVGVLFFVFALYFLSSFVWLVQIRGTERIDPIEVEEFLRENGVYAGAFKYNIDRKALQKGLMVRFPDISWANIDITGTKASVLLTETKPKVQILDNSTPCDIVAKKDGLITGIATSAGTPLVKPGDVVKAGDLLVSGQLVVGTEETGMTKKYVHAVSAIRAKMYYEFVFEVPLVYEEQLQTGNKKSEYALSLLGKNIKLSRVSIPYANYEMVRDRKQFKFGENYPLPFLFITTEYREIEVISKERTEEQAQRIAQEIVTSRIIREFDFNADIIDSKIEFDRQDDVVKVHSYITTVERIDEEREIIFTEQPNPPLES